MAMWPVPGGGHVCVSLLILWYYSINILIEMTPQIRIE